MNPGAGKPPATGTCSLNCAPCLLHKGGRHCSGRQPDTTHCCFEPRPRAHDALLQGLTTIPIYVKSFPWCQRRSCRSPYRAGFHPPPTRSTAIVWVQHCRCTSALRGRLSPMGIPPARSWPGGPGGTPVCPGGYWHRSACLRWKPRHSGGDIPHPYFMASRGYIAVCTDTVCTLSIHTRSREENVPPGTATQKQGCTVAAQGHTFRWG